MTNKTLPDGWQWKRLSDVVSINSGIALPEIFKGGYSNGEIEFFKVAQMNNDEKIMKNAEIFFNKIDAQKFKIKIFPKGSVLFPKRGGAILTEKKRILIKAASYDSNVMGLKSNPIFLSDAYLYIFVQSIKFSELVDTSTIPQINNKHIEKLQIPLPPLAEQKRIVAKIDAAFEQLDEAISLQKTNIARTETLKKALLVEQFSELPAEKKKLGEIATLGTGATPLTSNKAYYENGNVVWITSSSTNEPFVKTPEKFITEKALKETNCKTYPVGTLIIALYGQGKTRGQITELCIEAATNQACAGIILKEKSNFHRKFIKYFFLKSYTQLRAMSSGGTQENLNLNKIKTTEIPLPPLAEQERIVAYLDKSFAEIDKMLEAQRGRLAHLESMKKAILQEAFEGKL